MHCSDKCKLYMNSDMKNWTHSQQLCLRMLLRTSYLHHVMQHDAGRRYARAFLDTTAVS